MKACVLSKIGEISVCDREIPELREGEVLVKVKNAGICGSDIPRIYKTGAHIMPIIPGHEFSGIVEEGGQLKGKRVGIYPLKPCGKCESCRRKKYQMCENYDYLGSRSDGGFAEFVRVPEKNLFVLPDSVSLESAAMLEPLSVGIHAVRSCNINKNMTAAVSGPGTIGLLILMILMDLGIRDLSVIGTNNSQKERLKRIDFTGDFFIKGESSLQTDLYFEVSGTEEGFISGIRSLKPGGELVLVGNPDREFSVPKEVYWRILRKELRIHGIWNSEFSFDHLIDHPENKASKDEYSAEANYKDGLQDDWSIAIERIPNIRPERLISHRLRLCDIEKGLQMMKDKKEAFIKVMTYI